VFVVSMPTLPYNTAHWSSIMLTTSRYSPELVSRGFQTPLLQDLVYIVRPSFIINSQAIDSVIMSNCTILMP
jgi:hypothetical protein